MYTSMSRKLVVYWEAVGLCDIQSTREKGDFTLSCVYIDCLIFLLLVKECGEDIFLPFIPVLIPVRGFGTSLFLLSLISIVF